MGRFQTAFNFKLRRYILRISGSTLHSCSATASGGGVVSGTSAVVTLDGRGLRPFTFQLNISAVCGTRGV